MLGQKGMTWTDTDCPSSETSETSGLSEQFSLRNMHPLDYFCHPRPFLHKVQNHGHPLHFEMFVLNKFVQGFQIEYRSLWPIFFRPQEEMAYKLTLFLQWDCYGTFGQHFLNFQVQIVAFCFWEFWGERLPELHWGWHPIDLVTFHCLQNPLVGCNLSQFGIFRTRLPPTVPRTGLVSLRSNIGCKTRVSSDNLNTLEDVLSAAFWRSSGLFLRSYLRDLASIAGAMSTLGPVVVAQHICGHWSIIPPPYLHSHAHTDL